MSHEPRDLSPTASRWFALRTWQARHPLGAWLIVAALVIIASLSVRALGRMLPAPFLPFYPAIIVAALLGGRRMGYVTSAACLISATLFFASGGAPEPGMGLALAVCVAALVSALLVEILAQFSALADALRAREVVLASGTRALIERESQLSAALSELEALYDEAPIGLGFLDRDLRFVRINAALADMNGFSVEAHLGKSVWDLVPDLRASAEPVLLRVLDGNEVVKGVELSGETPAQPGVRRDWLEMFYPVHDSTGAVQGIGIFCEDVTETKRALERERLLTREVDHRAKNLLTVIQSVLKLTRSTGSIEEFKAAVTGRIQSLGRIHTLLAQNRWEAIHLDELVRQELEPFGQAVRIGSICRDLRIQPNVAQAISMILHELATNSVKHGALSGEGYVGFDCVVEGAGPRAVNDGAATHDGESRTSVEPVHAEPGWGEASLTGGTDGGAAAQTGWVTLTWHECGGPPVTPPDRGGFGTSLIRTAVKGLLAGELDYDLRPDGLACTIRFPLSRPVHPGTRPD